MQLKKLEMSWMEPLPLVLLILYITNEKKC